MAPRILFTTRAEKEFNELQQPDRGRLTESLVADAADPSHPKHDGNR
jgi:hypothetical protein